MPPTIIEIPEREELVKRFEEIEGRGEESKRLEPHLLNLAGQKADVERLALMLLAQAQLFAGEIHLPIVDREISSHMQALVGYDWLVPLVWKEYERLRRR